jgi:hypothetical protein
MSIFFDKFKYRWEIKDKYGHDIPIRDYNLSVLLGVDDYRDVNCDLILNIMAFGEPDSSNQYINYVSFKPYLNLLKINNLDFFCNSIEDAETLVDIWIKGSKLTIAPLYLKNNN